MLGRRDRGQARGGDSRPAAVATRAGTQLQLPPIAWAVDSRLVRREERVERVAGVDHCAPFCFCFPAQCTAHSSVSAGGRSRRQDRRGLRLGGRRPEMGWWLNRLDGLWFSGLFDEGPRRQRSQPKVAARKNDEGPSRTKQWG
eukprot:scaffold39118_cov52-Phaeocystis_antarctica.AAC.2